MRRAAAITVLAALLPAVGSACERRRGRRAPAGQGRRLPDRPSERSAGERRARLRAPRASRASASTRGDLDSLELVRSLPLRGRRRCTCSGSSPTAASRCSAAGVRANLDPDGRLINVGGDARADLQVDSDRAATCRRSRRCAPRPARPRSRPGRRARARPRARHDLRLRRPGEPDAVRRRHRAARLAGAAATPIRRTSMTRVVDAHDRRDAVPGRTSSADATGARVRQLPGRARRRHPGRPRASRRRARTRGSPTPRGCSATTPTSTRTPTTPSTAARPTRRPDASANEIPPSAAGADRRGSTRRARPRGHLGRPGAARPPGCSWNGFDTATSAGR